MNWTVIHASVSLIVWGTAFDKLRAIGWYPRDTEQRASCLALFAGALHLTVGLPPVSATIDRLTGIVNLAKLLTDGLLMITMWALLQMAVGVLVSEGVATGRRRVFFARPWLMLGTITLLLILFALAPVHEMETPGYTAFVAHYGGDRFVAEYIAVSIGYPAMVVGELFVLCRRGSREITNGALRRCTRLQSWGFAGLLALMAHEFLYVTARRLDLGYGYADTVRNALIAVSVALLMSGGLVGFHEWWYRYQDYRKLFALWRELRQATPEIAIPSFFRTSRSALDDALIVNELDLRLQRRRTDIWDRALALQPYIDAAVVKCAECLCEGARMTDRDSSAIIAAAALRSAARAKALGRQPMRRGVAPGIGATGGLSMRGDSTAREATHLQRVAWAYRHSPVVTAALAAAHSPGAEG